MCQFCDDKDKDWKDVGGASYVTEGSGRAPVVLVGLFLAGCLLAAGLLAKLLGG